jgi:hypothetical protein
VQQSLQSQKDENFPNTQHLGFCAELAGWCGWLSADTPEGLHQLERVFGSYRCEVAIRPTSGIKVWLGDGSAPRLSIHRNGRSCAFDELLAGLEWRRFVPIRHSARARYGDELFGSAPILEAHEEGFVVLRPELWPGLAQLAFVWLCLQEAAIISLHAAVSAAASHSLVLLGPSGAGKSTLSWALHQQGADYYGDEWTFFTLPEHHQYVWQRNLYLRPGGLQALDTPPESLTWYEAKPGDPKCIVPLPKPSRPCPRDNALLCFLNGFAEKPDLTPMPGGEAARRLLQSMGYADPSVVARLEVAAGLANHYPCLRLTLGPPDATAALLLAHVRSLS